MSDTRIGSRAAPVSFRMVTKVYSGDVAAVQNINLEIGAGQLVTLLGPSGCGKTTTLRLIAGLEMATSGQILIGERDVTRLPATDREVSMVFQSYALFPHMTVMENVSYGLNFSGYRKTEAKARAMQGLNLVGLEDYGARLPSELSGGQQQRVAVARALVLEPQVLLFDEPLSNLDAKLRRQVREEIREIQQNLHLTVVYVTHDQEEALAVSDEIIVMRNAEIAQSGTPRELYTSPNSRFVADFIGEANLVPCEIHELDGDMAEVSVDGFRHRLPARGLPLGRATLAVRPSRLVVGAKDGFPAEVSKATYVGNRMEYTLATSFGSIFAVHEDVDDPWPVGQEVTVGLASAGPVSHSRGLVRASCSGRVSGALGTNLVLSRSETVPKTAEGALVAEFSFRLENSGAHRVAVKSDPAVPFNRSWARDALGTGVVESRRTADRSVSGAGAGLPPAFDTLCPARPNLPPYRNDAHLKRSAGDRTPLQWPNTATAAALPLQTTFRKGIVSQSHN